MVVRSVEFAVIKFPGSTKVSPTLPEIGARISVNSKFNSASRNFALAFNNSACAARSSLFLVSYVSFDIVFAASKSFARLRLF